MRFIDKFISVFIKRTYTPLLHPDGEGYFESMNGTMKKVILFLPEDLIERVQVTTAQSFDVCIRHGLEQLSEQNSFEGIRNLRGKLDLNLNIRQLRNE